MRRMNGTNRGGAEVAEANAGKGREKTSNVEVERREEESRVPCLSTDHRSLITRHFHYTSMIFLTAGRREDGKFGLKWMRLSRVIQKELITGRLSASKSSRSCLSCVKLG